MKAIIPILLLLSISNMAGCSSDTDTQKQNTANKDHFLSDQEKALKKAEAVNQLIQDTAAKQRQLIDEQGG